MSKSLIKLIDAALIPAAVMICGKVAGLWFANTVFNLDWGIQTDPNNFFSVQIKYLTIDEQITATTYSNLIMYLFVFMGFTTILTRALVFSSKNITPSMVARLATNNLLNLIKDSFEIYYHASVWLVMIWLALFALLLNVVIGKSYVWTAIVSTSCTLVSTIILLRDVAKEIKIGRKDLPKVFAQSQKLSQ